MTGSRRVRTLLADGLLVALILVAGGLGSVGAYRSLAGSASAQQREQLTAVGQSVVGAFDLQLVRAVEALQASALMLSAEPGLSRAQFSTFGAGLLREPSVLALLEWQPLVARAQLDAFERQAARGWPGFRVVEPGPAGQSEAFVPVQRRDEHVPVLYSWPEQGAAVGVDMAFDPRRMRSKHLARDSGVPVASETFSIIRRGAAPGSAAAVSFAISAPVYRGPQPDGTAERQVALSGYVVGVIELPALMREAALRADANQLDCLVYDQGERPRRQIFANLGEDSDLRDAQTFEPGDRDVRLSVDVGGRAWQIVLHPRPGFTHAASHRTAVAAGGGGALATLLVALAVARSLWVRRRLERTENALAEDRQHLNNVLDGTAAGTWDWQVDSGALTVNERWAQMLGRRREDLMPITATTWERLCNPADLPATFDAIQAHLQGQTDRFLVEFRMLHAEGHWVWVQSAGRVFGRSAEGKSRRVAGTHLDISRRKLDEQRLQDDARALEAANRQLRDLAIVDALTGAFNRRHFNEVCQSTLAQGLRGQGMAMCMLDVDHFKAYNDCYGHQAGDAVLQALTTTLKAGLKRSTDALFRLGGEEFGVLFTASCEAAAQHFAQEMCRAVRGLALPHEGSPGGVVTASFGLAWWAAPAEGLTAEAMYAAADAALYEAKRAGRDQVVSRAFAAVAPAAAVQA